jgi:antitoxin component YwqK of YwqJK toxin-antitoxin module
MLQFYVYGLVDPRTNSIFYIGKGKGKRVFQHATEKEEIHTNTEKLKIIIEIKRAGLEVGHTIIAENLSEGAALLLERFLIYRIGRSIFDEGYLTNIVPGGLWHKEAPLFIKKESLPSIETIHSRYPELIPILEQYPQVAKKFTGLRCPSNSDDENLYVFDATGKKLNVWDINYFIQIFGLGHALDLINVLKDTSAPVYAWNRVWSKSNYELVEDTSRIPFEDFDILDLYFVGNVNKALVERKKISLNCYYTNEKKLGEVYISNNALKISLTYYYLNGNKKHLTNYYEQKLNGKCLSWHPNGQLKEEIEYNQNKRLSKQCFYPSGNIELIENYNEDGTGRSVRTWYDSGQASYESNEDGTSFNYSETGILLSKGIRTGYLHEGGNLIMWEYSEDGEVKKETKQYYVNGLLHGYEKSFYDTGELRREVDYTNGHNNKIIKTYKKHGEVTIK